MNFTYIFGQKWYFNEIFSIQLSFDMCCTVKSWGEYKYHGSPYIQGTTLLCDTKHENNTPCRESQWLASSSERKDTEVESDDR